MLTTATRGMATMFGNAAAREATCHNDDRRCARGTKRRPQTHIAPSPMPIVTRLNTTTSTVSLSNLIDMLAPVVEIMRHGILCVIGSTVSAPRHQRLLDGVKCGSWHWPST